MEISKVVTCFLEYKGKILLVRRSDDVGTYKGRWAGVSGFIEKGEEPLETAFKEIREETGLGKNNLELLKKGSSFPVIDENLKKEWIIHPFLFRTNRKRIRLDREHKQSKWVDPKEMKKMDTVPELSKSWEMVKK